MSIPVSCSCGKRFAARDELAGKRVKCPGCQQPITIPATDTTANTNPPEDQQSATKDVTIGVRCACGRIVKAGIKLLGKRVKCPGCGQPLMIQAAETPQAKSRAPASKAKSPAKKAASAEPSPAAAIHSAEAATVMGALFDEIGFGTSITKSRCPSCKFDVDPEAVLCVKCGFHMETGKHLKTKVIKRKRF